VKNEPIDDESVSKVKLEGTNNDIIKPGFPDPVYKQPDALNAENSIEDLADDIVSRVRNQLYPDVKVEDVPYYRKTQQTSGWSAGDSVSVQTTARSDVSSLWGGSDRRSEVDDDQYDSHICPVCRQLMVSFELPMSRQHINIPQNRGIYFTNILV
jgi:hypothetical protein